MNIQDYPTYIPQFRGRSKSGEWHFGFCLGHTTNYKYSFLSTETSSHLPVETDTLSISTGLKDANNQMIFDGDILDFKGDKVLVYWNTEHFQWKIKYLEDFYGTADNELGCVAAELTTLGTTTTKIIGNKWDNSDWFPINETMSIDMMPCAAD